MNFGQRGYYQKIGFVTGPGGNPTGIGDHIRALDAAGIPVCIKAMDSETGIYDLVQVMKNSDVPHVGVFRRSVPYQGAPPKEDPDLPYYNLSPAEAALEHWTWHEAGFPQLIKDNRDKLWVEVINEPNKDDDAVVEWLAEFAIECAKLALAAGYNLSMFGWSGGTPEPYHWNRPKMKEAIRLYGSYPKRLSFSLHEYSFSNSDIFNEDGYLVGRFQYLFDLCEQNEIPKPTVLITEFGWNANSIPDSQAVAMNHIKLASDLYYDYPEILGVNIWYLGPGFGGIANDVQKLIAPVTEYSVSKGYIPVKDESQPPTLLLPGGARVDFKRTYVLFHKLIPVNWITRTHEKTMGEGEYVTVGFSADDAFLGNYLEDGVVTPLSRRRVIAVNPELWGNDPHGSGYGLSGFAEAYYPGSELISVRAINAESCAAGVLAAIKGVSQPTRFEFISAPLPLPMATSQWWGENPSWYKPYGLPGHDGLDSPVPTGTPVYAVADGAVASIETRPDATNYGINVRITHIDDYQTIYAHLSEYLVEEGQAVLAGQLIGRSGNTGRLTTGPHLHLGLKHLGYIYTDEFGVWPYNLVNPTLPHYLGKWVTPPDPQPGPARTLVGLHASADGGDYRTADLVQFETLKPDTIKVMSSHSFDSISKLRNEHPNATYIIRAYLSFGNRVVTPQQFVDWTFPDVQRAISALGVSSYLVELHNEPNLYQEGAGLSWKDGSGFSTWYSSVLDRYRQLLPQARFIFPGLSPGGSIDGIRLDSNQFILKAQNAVLLSDGLGVHVYWATQNDWPMSRAIDETKKIHALFPELPLWITEVSNNKFHSDPEFKAAEYAIFSREIGKLSYVSGLTYFVVSAGRPDWNWSVGSCETWGPVNLAQLVREELDK